ncbi:MAG: ABC transporter ATP-binding protein [Candidatus Saccharimonas sp.]
MKTIFTVIGYTKRLWPYMAFLAIGSLAISLLGLAIPFIIKFATDAIVDTVSGKSTFPAENIIWFAVALFVVALINSTLNDIIGYYGDILSIRLRQQLSNMYFKHLLSLPQTYYDDELTGTIINRLNRAITNITQFINSFANNLLQMVITLVISVAVMVYYSWALGALIILLIPIYVWLTHRTSGRWQVYEKEKNFHFDVASGRFNEVISHMRLVKSFGSEAREYSSFIGHFKEMVGITRKQSYYWHKMDAIRNSVLALVYLGVYSMLFYQTITKAITIGDMVLLITLVQRVSAPLNGMSFFVDMYQRAITNSKDYIEAMNVEPELTVERDEEASFKKASVVFRNVDFGYNADSVLKDISFEVKSGESLALVGESGGGKTTITNLLMSLYNPTAGEILIEGKNIAHLTLPSLRRSIATVFQDAGLFSGTIRENIAYGRPDASEADIIEAAKAANAYDFVMEHGDGLDTEIGERGIKLSGGQQQRIAIARAILKDAPILVLDEATSSLDSRSEASVQEALERLMKSRTVIIVAHRLSTIANVDRIVTLRKGKVDEIGTPQKLATTGGIYAELLKLQLGSTKRARERLEGFDIAE